MATAEKRGNSYRITVSCGYDINGKQLRKSTTWKPEPGMTSRQIAKELERQKVLFEEKCRTGQVLDGSIRLADFLELWFRDYAEKQLRKTTVDGYRKCLKRVLPALGHIRLDKLQPHHLMAFYANLAEPGIRTACSVQCTPSVSKAMQEKGWNAAELARQTGLTPTRISQMLQRKGVASTTAQKVADALGLPLDHAFTPTKKDEPLTGNTVNHYHRFLSTVLSSAVQWQVIFSNPCERVKPPKIERKETAYLDEEQARQLLAALDHEDMQHKTIVYTLLQTGLRRGELCGLEWDDVDMEKCILHVRRSSLYLPGEGVFTDETKNRSSERAIQIPVDLVQILRSYRAWQSEQRMKAGDRWQESGRIFTSWDGAPIHPDSITNWFTSFIKRNNLPPVTIHGLRHTSATLLIASGTNIRTISARLGHSQTSTTMNIYAHAIKSADAAAAETLGDILNPTKKRA